MMSKVANSKNILLRTDKLVKRFGGVTATKDVSLEVIEGEIHAIIGPNGAGKTTLVGLLSGEMSPDEGQIWFGDETITRTTTYKRSHLGMARSYQITSVFQDMQVIDNVSLAVQAHDGHSFRFWSPARTASNLREEAIKALAAVQLEGRAEEPVSTLSHGEQRQLEVAMAIATDPKLLLLDEPMAGMGTEETADMVGVLQRLKDKTTMLLVEHDMDAVFALADRISVLVYGEIIATGSPFEIRDNDKVRQAYLGEGGGVV